MTHVRSSLHHIWGLTFNDNLAALSLSRWHVVACVLDRPIEPLVSIRPQQSTWHANVILRGKLHPTLQNDIFQQLSSVP